MQSVQRGTLLPKCAYYGLGAASVTTLKASLLASAIGTAAWLFGFTHKIWPAHPQWAVFFITLGATALLMYVFRDAEN